jgi:hypothetical protein
MKLVNSNKSLTVACALSLVMGMAGIAHADHKGVPHGKSGKGPKLSIDVEVFCGDPAMVPIYSEDGTVIGYEEGVDTNAAVRVTDVSDDNQLENPQVSVDVMCVASVKDGPGKPEQEWFDGKLFPSSPVEDSNVYTYDCDLESEKLPDNATEWKATAVVQFKDGDETRQVFDSCEEITIP